MSEPNRNPDEVPSLDEQSYDPAAPEQPAQPNPRRYENSSQNARTHGCCSTKLIIEGEDRRDFDILRQGWYEDYRPGTHTSTTLLNEVVHNHWFYMRNHARFMRVDTWLEGVDPVAWTEQHHKTYDRFRRYRTSTERSFYRSFNSLEKHRADRTREGRRIQNDHRQAEREAERQEEKMRKRIQERIEQEQADREREQKLLAQQAQADQARQAPAVPAPEASPAKSSPKKPAKHNPNQEPWNRFEQWVEVRIRNGRTETHYTPTNEQVIEEAATMQPPPDVMFRRLLFLGGVPPEYEWVKPNDNLRQNGGAGLQRMSWDAWLDCIEREKDGHLTPAAFGKIDRWRKK